MKFLFHIMAALSSLLRIATAVLSISGKKSPIHFHFQWNHAAWEVVAQDGRFDLDNEPQLKIEYVASMPIRQEMDETANELASNGVGMNGIGPGMAKPQMQKLFAKYGLLSTQLISTMPTRGSRRSVPAVVVLLTSALMPATWLMLVIASARRRGRRLQNNLCVACGYDLRATTDRCPECGTISAKVSTQSFISSEDQA